MYRFVGDNRFSFFAFIHLLYKYFHGGFGNLIYLLSYGAGWDYSFVGNRRVIKAYNAVIIRKRVMRTNQGI